MALERFIGNVLSFPSSPNLPVAEYNKELKNLNDFLNKAPAQAIVGTRDNDPLDLLDNHANSLGVLYVLYVHYQHPRIFINSSRLSH